MSGRVKEKNLTRAAGRKHNNFVFRPIISIFPIDISAGDVRTRESIAKRLYPLAAGFIIMYDVTDIQSYNDIYNW